MLPHLRSASTGLHLGSRGDSLSRMTPSSAQATKSRPKKPTKKRRRESDAALERRLRPVVRKLLDEMLGDRLDYAASEAALADGAPIPAAEVWKRLGI